MKAGACRYDTEGYVTEHITQEEEQYAQARLERCADRTGSRMSCGRSWQNNKSALCMTEGNSEKIGKTDIQSFDGENIQPFRDVS